MKWYYSIKCFSIFNIIFLEVGSKKQEQEDKNQKQDLSTVSRLPSTDLLHPPVFFAKFHDVIYDPDTETE
jgi:hypothetical protein